MTERRVLILPGWLSSGPEHWQSRWEALHGYQRLEQSDWQQPLRGDWMARLDEALLQDPRPSLLVAHSLGCQLVASWAAHSRLTDRVCGALLVAPPDTEQADLPPQLHNWRQIRRPRLPFPSIAVISSDDPFCAEERGVGMAQDWGSQLLRMGPRGHLNADSGLGDWPEGQVLLAQLVANGS